MCTNQPPQLKYEFDVEFDIPVTYPMTSPEIALPELDGKTAKVNRPYHNSKFKIGISPQNIV